MEVLMGSSILLKNENSIQSVGQQPALQSVGNGASDNAWTDVLHKGQRISGVVTSVGDQVTLDFNGYEASVSKDNFNDVRLGEVKNFEVVRVTDNTVELKLLDSAETQSQQPCVAILGVSKDQDTFLSQKEQDSKQSEAERQLQKTREKMDDILTGLTAGDYQLLLQEGFPIGSYTIDGLHAAINRVKSAENKQQAKQEEKGDLKSRLFTEAIVAHRLQSENLPVTKESVQKIMTAMNFWESIPKINDLTVKCLIKQGSEPTIGNIYRAYYSGNFTPQKQPSSLSSGEWEELKPQAGEVIRDAGYEVNEENLNDAKWLIENGLPLTAESFTDKKELEGLKDSISKEGVLDKIVEGMKNNTSPLDVPLYDKQEQSYEKLLSDIQSIGDETIRQAVAASKEITIKNLTAIRKNQTSDQNTDNTEITRNLSPVTVRAQRQLEEIRLKMTLQAAATLEKKGFFVETEHLEKVVEALRALEDNYYKELLQEGDVEGSAENIQTIKDTSLGLEQLKYVPEYILGSTLSERNIQTIPDLLDEGTKLQAKLTRANEAYQTLMTEPNREYGDSIQKAFGNITSILDSLDLENTQSNQRAVRILGYNGMEITEDNIGQVKAYDQEVTTMIKNLHPGVAVRMIKEGINPLGLPIQELNETIDRIKEEQGITTADQFGIYLSKLEKADGITPEERKAYIGIYRLLHTIEKTDGAALGSVLKTGREVTLEHLLTAVRTSKKGSVNAAIDDAFGALKHLSSDEENITDQLKAAFTQGEDLSQQSQGNDSGDSNRYIRQMIKQIREELSPGKLQGIVNDRKSSDFKGAEGFAESDLTGGVWDSIKDVPVEMLSQMLSRMQNRQEADEKSIADKLQELDAVYKNSDQAIRFLKGFDLPDTSANILMAKQMLSNEGMPVLKNLSKKHDNTENSTELDIKKTEELSDKLIDKASMNEAYETLNNEAGAVLTNAVLEGVIDSKRLAELKNMGMQMTFLKTLAAKEFYQIPIETKKGITNINLTIIRGTEDSGKVKVNLWSEKLGNVRAELSVKDQVFRGFVSGDSWGELEELKKNAEQISEAAREEGLTVKNLDFGRYPSKADGFYAQNSTAETADVSSVADTERVLYRLAKAFVRTVRATEMA
jgi:hypothetical protein